MRLDLFLSGKPDIKSRSQAQQLIESGCVQVNGTTVTKSSMDVSSTDSVTWIPPSQPSVPTTAHDTPTFQILYEDDACIVIDKPAGVIVHPGAGVKNPADTVVGRLPSLFAERRLPFSPSEVLVHRLDKDTTGCLLIAKTPYTHLALQQAFADRAVQKHYLAIVDGVPSPRAAVIDAPIGRHATQRVRMSVHRSTASREARTTYRTLAAHDGCSLLHCTLHTGRTHQIRVHLTTIGHPILGDPTYTTPHAVKTAERLHVERVCLHAWILGFHSPAGVDVRVCSPLPQHFSDLCQSLGWIQVVEHAAKGQ